MLKCLKQCYWPLKTKKISFDWKSDYYLIKSFKIHHLPYKLKKNISWGGAHGPPFCPGGILFRQTPVKPPPKFNYGYATATEAVGQEGRSVKVMLRRVGKQSS